MPARTYAVTIVERWDLEMVHMFLQSDSIPPGQKSQLRAVLAVADKDGNVDVLYRLRNGRRTQTPVHLAQLNGELQLLCSKRSMQCFKMTYPDGTTQDIFNDQASFSKLGHIIHHLLKQWRNESSPYSQGVCAMCSITTNLKRCGQCDFVQYCSREHQQDHWTDSHRRECHQVKTTYYPYANQDGLIILKPRNIWLPAK
jgi:hypothetical protein